jgi:hypothetical protein
MPVSEQYRQGWVLKKNREMPTDMIAIPWMEIY